MRPLILSFLSLAFFACAPAENTADPEPRSEPDPEVSLCSNTCQDADDGVCDDGGDNAQYDGCRLGTDCNDCGSRANPEANPDPSPDASPDASPDGGPSPAPSPNGEPDPTPAPGPSGEPEPTPDVNVACGERGFAAGTLRSSIADIPAHAESNVDASFSHKLDVDPSEDACVSAFNTVVRLHPNGCELSLNFGIDDEGNGFLSSASFNADSFCIGVSDQEEGTYSFHYQYSARAYPIWIEGPFDRVPDAESALSCFENRSIRFPDVDIALSRGEAESDIILNLKDLQLLGSFESEGSTGYGCRLQNACPSFFHDGGNGEICFDGASCLNGYYYEFEQQTCVLGERPSVPPPANLPEGYTDALGAEFPSTVTGSVAQEEIQFYAFVATTAAYATFSTWTDVVNQTCEDDTVLDFVLVRDGEIFENTSDDDGGTGSCSRISYNIEEGDMVILGVKGYSSSAIPLFQLRLE